MTTTTTYIHTTTSKPSTLLLVKTILCFSWQINCKIEEIILKQRTYSPPTTILPTALILKAVSICCISDELSTRNTCMGFGLWRRNGHKQFFGENRALYFWKRVFITKTWPCPNTCLTKTEGYDHIFRFEIIFFFWLNPQCDAHNFAILAGKYLQLEYLENQLQCDRHLQPPQGHHFSSYVGRHS